MGRTKFFGENQNIFSVVSFNYITGLDGTVTMSSANGLVGTGFTSRYWLQPRDGF